MVKEELTTENNLTEISTLDKAHETSKTYIYTSMGLGLIPIPAIDFVAITLTQVKMLKSFAKLYDLEFKDDIGKSLITSLIGGILPNTLGLSLASLTKSIPLIGPLFGATAVSMFAGASTYAISRVFIQHFESGGTFLNFDPETVREYFAQEFKKGQAVAEKVKQSPKS
jgi:uncharacterized protein (DUF697 family)